MKTMMARDEREASVDQAGDRLAYIVVSYGLLAIVAFRSFVDGQASWELLALVVFGGLVSAGYRLSQGVLSGRAVALLAVTAVAALAAAAAILFASGV